MQREQVDSETREKERKEKEIDESHVGKRDRNNCDAPLNITGRLCGRLFDEFGNYPCLICE